MNLFKSVAAATSRIWRAAFVAAALLLLMPKAGAWAQQPQLGTAATTGASNNVYTFVEKMPELPAGGGVGAIVALIHKQIRLPLFCGQYPVRSRAVVEFTVTQTGVVSDVHMLQNIDSRVDSAIVQAVRGLPLLTPGRQHGLPVSVKYALPVIFRFQ